MRVLFEVSFEKDLRKIKDKTLLRRVAKVIEEVKGAEDLSAIGNLKKLTGHQTFYRIRIGDYRVGLEIIEEKVIFTRALNRKDIYRYFP